MELFEQAKGGGYHLKRFELYNWGCFSNRIWTVAPGCQSSLLTGANGSGKTTLVDGLITLLVPFEKRHYNQSSGAERKRERNEDTYVRGAYNTVRDEGGVTGKTLYLRDRESYSVLLGVFVNTDYGNSVTLGQLRWYTASGLQKWFFIAKGELGIQDDILPLDKNHSYKKRLAAKYTIDFFDNFKAYMNSFMRVFGFKSDKALSLFSQIVGVKVIGDLNTFIRQHMLEASDTEKEFQQLLEHYQTLMHAHKQIEKAKKQLELLEPVIQHGRDYESIDKKLSGLQELKQAIPGVYAEKKLEAGRLELQDLNDTIRELDEKIEALKKRIQAFHDEITDIRVALGRDDVSIRMEEIRKRIQSLKEILEIRKQAYKKYDNTASKLELPKAASSDSFTSNRKRAQEQLSQSSENIAALEDRLFKERTKIEKLDQEIQNIDEMVISLSKRKNNIPLKSIRIRDEITASLGLDAQDLPFVGELLRVGKDHLYWEKAIEKVLHSFALCLIVPPEHYERVNKYVHSHNLKGRLIYFQVREADSILAPPAYDADSLVSKVEIKPNTVYHEWLETQLVSRFDYICTDNMKDFSRLRKAVSSSGLVKSNDRHEKDDRPARDLREFYVLGWDNIEKIKLLNAKKLKLRREADEEVKHFEKTEESLKKERKIEELASYLLSFESFASLDWWSEDKKIREMDKEWKTLKNSSAKVKEMEDTLKSITQELDQSEQELSKTIEIKGRTSNRIEILSEKLKQLEAVIINYKTDELIPYVQGIEEYLENKNARLFSEIEAAEEKFREKNNLDIEKTINKLGNKKASLLGAMRNFIQPSEKIIRAYPDWRTITMDLRSELESLQEFKEMYQRVKRDDLPNYRHRFKKFLNGQMHDNMINFRETLQKREVEIRENIEHLNTCLHDIDYNRYPQTYITILVEPTRDTSVREFKSTLITAIGDAGKIASGDEAELEAAFFRIQELILRLRDEESWRRKVLDVRNWLSFGAIEKYREDDDQKQYYQDSQSLSGGERAKLAYTILASALSYQFNIGTDSGNSFRFVMLDEAFSKVDPENSSFAMELFKKLDLQLMVVTPLDKVNIVEEYVNAVHFIEKREDDTALIHNLTWNEYQSGKEEFLEDEETVNANRDNN
ncbi:MAG: ATP-binding protein [Spirochaetia bacterium]